MVKNQYIVIEYKKKHFVMFHKAKIPISHVEINIDDKAIDRVDWTKFVSVVIDSKLSLKIISPW